MIKKSLRIPLIALIIIVVIVAILFWDLTESRKIYRADSSQNNVESGTRYSPADYVGKENCVNCHQRQHNLWSDSDHDLAMQVANDSTMLGNFDDAEFTHFGVTSKFYKKDTKYFVETEGLDEKWAAAGQAHHQHPACRHGPA